MAPPTGQCSGGGQHAAARTEAAAPSADEGAVWRDQVVAGVGRGLWSPSRGAAAAAVGAHGSTRAAVPRGDRTPSVRAAGAQPAPAGLRGPAPNRIWAGDLTAIATRAGWVYLAVILDLYSRRVIGWAMSARPDQQVALTALQIAMTHRRPRPGLIHHTDQGATYTSVAYQRQLVQTGLRPA